MKQEITNPGKVVHVVGTQQFGVLFRDLIISLGVDTRQRQPHEPMFGISDADFAYNETVSQALLQMTSNQSAYLESIKSVPQMLFYEHISILKDPLIGRTFSEAAKKFAMELYFQINSKMKLHSTSSYLLEAAAPNYVVIAEIPNANEGFPNAQL